MTDRNTHFRDFCLGLPEVVEVLQFGYPWYKAGKKSFAILGNGTTVSINLTHELQDLMLQDERFERSHYVGQHGWVTFTLADVEVPTVERLVLAAYRKVALKRMLTTLDAR